MWSRRNGNGRGDRKGIKVAKTTIKDIAEKAGVSIGTVDRVLHNRGRVSAENEAKIREICAQLAYEPNAAGKAMAMQKKSTVVAVVVNAKNLNPFSRLIYEGLEKIADEISDYNIRFSFYDIVENTQSEMEDILDQLMDEDIGGLIIKPINNLAIKTKLNKLWEAKRLPIVTCTSDIDGINKIAYVGQDHFAIGRLMANTLCRVTQGKLSIVAAVGPLTNNARREKLNGFLSYLEQSGREYEVLDMCEVPYDNDLTYAKALSLLSKNPGANAFYIHSPDFEPCVKAMESYGNFTGTSFTFGHKNSCSEYIRSGRLSFGVYEAPYEHGYYAGSILFDYLLNNLLPEEGVHIFEGKIAFEENC